MLSQLKVVHKKWYSTLNTLSHYRILINQWNVKFNLYMKDHNRYEDICLRNLVLEPDIKLVGNN